MTVESKLDKIISMLEAPITNSPPAIDLSAFATKDDIKALSDKLDALAGTVGTESAPVPAPAPGA